MKNWLQWSAPFLKYKFQCQIIFIYASQLYMKLVHLYVFASTKLYLNKLGMTQIYRVNTNQVSPTKIGFQN